MKLSVLIPARNEMFLQKTIDEVLKHGNPKLTDVIVVLDGAWPHEEIKTNPRISVIYQPESIGQRAATNVAARMARSDYIMKLDAHCMLSPRFDEDLIKTAEKLDPSVMQVPKQFNLHAFDWVCECGHRRYQGRTEPCKKCGKDMTREMVWRPRKSRLTTAWRFDQQLHFQYFPEFQREKRGQPDELGVSDTMSLLGACWFLRRDRYWEIDGLDEAHGGWGQMGTELSCKQWLSGSRVVTNHNAWFAHLFRTQGGDFGFPYPMKKKQTDGARAYSQDLWRNGKWPKATRPLQWMIDKFNPPGWEKKDADLPDVGSVGVPSGPGTGDADSTPDPVRHLSKGIVYYSDCRGDGTILNSVRARLGHAVNGFPIVSSCLADVPFGTTRIVHPKLDRGYLTMFEQILAGLELCKTDVVFFCEHDVLYPEEHFDFVPKEEGVVYYNENVWKVDAKTGHALHYLVRQTSGLCAYRETLLEHYRKRVEIVREKGFSRKMGFEPGTHGRSERVDDLKSEAWMSERPLVDIRHGKNLTPSRWKKEQFRQKRFCRGWTESDEVPGWGRTKDRFDEFLREAV